ncbi:MAG: acyl-ACP--UDP-N-acetylglucosamine O-acyltransferase [Leptospirales bacterium]
MANIHPTALVDSKAQLDDSVTVEPFSIIGPDVSIGAGTKIGPYVQLKGKLDIGKNNQIFHAACIGENGQDLTFDNSEAAIKIGDNNVLREYVSIHQPSKPGNLTQIGNNNYLMCNVHLGHDVQMKNNNVLTPAVAVGGHVQLDDNVYIGGLSAIHQFVKIGKFSIVGGVTAVLRDIPPYSMFSGEPGGITGLNMIGLRRAEFPSDRISLIKNIYKTVYMRGNIPKKAASILEEEFLNQTEQGSEERKILQEYIDFIRSSDRGISARLAH